MSAALECLCSPLCSYVCAGLSSFAIVVLIGLGSLFQQDYRCEDRGPPSTNLPPDSRQTEHLHILTQFAHTRVHGSACSPAPAALFPPRFLGEDWKTEAAGASEHVLAARNCFITAAIYGGFLAGPGPHSCSTSRR